MRGGCIFFGYDYLFENKAEKRKKQFLWERIIIIFVGVTLKNKK
jgi:hypothetical protein